MRCEFMLNCTLVSSGIHISPVARKLTGNSLIVQVLVQIMLRCIDSAQMNFYEHIYKPQSSAALKATYTV